VSTPWLKKAYQDNHIVKDDQTKEDYDSISHEIFEMTFVKIIVEILLICPHAWICTTVLPLSALTSSSSSYSKLNESTQDLTFGKLTSSLLQHIVIISSSDASVFHPYHNHLSLILQQLDQFSSRHISSAYAIVEHSKILNRFYQNKFSFTGCEDQSRRSVLISLVKPMLYGIKICDDSLSSHEDIRQFGNQLAIVKLLVILLQVSVEECDNIYDERLPSDILKNSVNDLYGALMMIISHGYIQYKVNILLTLLILITVKDVTLSGYNQNISDNLQYLYDHLNDSKLTYDDIHRNIIQSYSLDSNQIELMNCFNIHMQSKTLMRLLSTPEFLRHLLIYGILATDGDEKIMISLRYVSFLLLNALAKYIIAEELITNSSIQFWCSLLSLLKIMQWKYRAIVLNPNHHPLKMNHIKDFIHKIEELSSLSRFPSALSCYGRALVLGLYHHDSFVRSICCMRLCDHELRRGSKAGTDKDILSFSTVSNASDEAPHSHFIEAYDPLLNIELKSLSSIFFEITDHINELTTASESCRSKSLSWSDTQRFQHSYSFQDILKLSALSFGKTELKIRIAAISQLKEILSDEYMMR
jgi:hypothetical protein